MSAPDRPPAQAPAAAPKAPKEIFHVEFSRLKMTVAVTPQAERERARGLLDLRARFLDRAAVLAPIAASLARDGGSCRTLLADGSTLEPLKGGIAGGEKFVDRV